MRSDGEGVQELDGEYRTRLGRFVAADVEERYETQRLSAARRMAAFLLLALGVIPIIGVAVDLLHLSGGHLVRALVARTVLLGAFWIGVVLVRKADSLARTGLVYTVAIVVGVIGYGVIAASFYAVTGRSDHEIVLGVMSALIMAAHPQSIRRSWPLLLAFLATTVGVDLTTDRDVAAAVRSLVTVLALGSFGSVANAAIHAQARTIFAFNERLARAETRRRKDHEADAHAARHALERRDAEWRSIVDNAPVLVMLVDASDTVVFANHAASGLGLAAGQTFSSRLRATSFESDGAPFVRVFGEGILNDFEAVLVDGGLERTFSFRAAPVGVEPPFEEATVIGIDTTEAKALTHELIAAQKQQTLGALAGGIAHDFNNLLMVIMSAAELLIEQGGLESDLLERAQDIRDASSRAANLTRQLLLMSRRNPSRGAAIDVNGFLARMKKLLDRMIGVEVSLALDLEPSVPNVYADPSHLEQIVLNLVVNARDAMPEGGAIRVCTRCHGSGVELSVEDEGVGMDAETQAKIFEPFFTTKPPSEGTGLGLATVKNVVGHLRGTIDVESTVGRGTRFRVALPGMATAVRRETTAPEVPSRPLRVLVVDDDASVQRLCCAMLEHVGHQVLAANDLAAALAALERSPEIEVLLTDVRLPQNAGPQIAAAARCKNPHLGVVFMSGFVHDHDLLDRVEAGSEILLDKPFSSQQLIHALNRALHRVQSASPPG